MRGTRERENNRPRIGGIRFESVRLFRSIICGINQSAVIATRCPNVCRQSSHRSNVDRIYGKRTLGPTSLVPITFIPLFFLIFPSWCATLIRIVNFELSIGRNLERTDRISRSQLFLYILSFFNVYLFLEFFREMYYEIFNWNLLLIQRIIRFSFFF